MCVYLLQPQILCQRPLFFLQWLSGLLHRPSHDFCQTILIFVLNLSSITRRCYNYHTFNCRLSSFYIPHHTCNVAYLTTKLRISIIQCKFEPNSLQNIKFIFRHVCQYHVGKKCAFHSMLAIAIPFIVTVYSTFSRFYNSVLHD